ncbi:MAG: hypothetical protein WDZ74_01375, partial [Candidatus Paceibacterota bacterium]
RCVMASVILVLCALLVALFLTHGLAVWVISLIINDLLKLFYRDEERWWWEYDLPQAIGRPGFLTRVALSLLNEDGVLEKRVLVIYGIRVYPQEGGEYPGARLHVRLDKRSGRKKKKEKEEAWAKRTLPSPIPLYNTVLYSLIEAVFI